MAGAGANASSAFNQAFNTAGMFGGDASAISGNLTPFLSQEMTAPAGIGMTGLSAENAAATGAAGGGLSAATGMMAQRAGASRNAGGFQAGSDAAARDALKVGAGASEGIAANNEMLKNQQRQEGAEGLGNLYKTDVSGMTSSMGQEAPDANAQTNAQQNSWLNQSLKILGTLGGMAGGAGGLMTGMANAGLTH